MSTQGVPDEGTDWANLEPRAPDEVARDIRIMLAAGRDRREIRAWLHGLNYSAE